MKLSRRHFLHSLGGGVLALPALEYFMDGKAWAQTMSQPRYVVLFAGISTGSSDGNRLRPNSTYGQAYPATSLALKPLVTRGVRDDVALVSKLRLPRKTLESQTVSPGGMGIRWHDGSMGVVLSGQRIRGAGNRDLFPVADPTASTSDVLVSNAWNSPGVHYRVQSVVQSNTEGTMSWKKQANGTVTPNAPTVNVRTAFDALFGQPDLDAATRARLQLQKKTAVDRALGKRALLMKVGAADKARLEQHFDELQALEARLAVLPTGTCASLPTAPTDNLGESDFYAQEKERGPIFVNLIKAAMACNLTRVATLCITKVHSHLRVQPLVSGSGLTFNADTSPLDFHETSHRGGLPEFQRAAMGWHIDLFAQLVSALKGTNDVTGAPMLDNTAVSLVFEGGAGADPEENTAMSSHSGDDMNALCAGLAVGKAASKGMHLDAANAHPSSVLLTAMQNVGVPASALNEVSTTIAALKK
jgi:Protein of unknown function (DUF1552)